MPDKVFVVIVTYNGMEWLNRCLSSLRGSATAVSTVVIDNCSNDGSQALVKNEFPEVIFIQAEHNLGFGQANNVGIKKAIDAGADYVFLLNQDAWVEAGTIGGLIEIHKNNSQFGILSPMHLNSDYSALDYNFSRYIIPELCPGLYSDIYTNNLKEVYTAPFINAAAWLLSKECIEKVGLFDPLFFHYGEDRNYSQRVLFHGFKIGVCPSERIVHDRDNRKGVAKGFDGRKERQRLMMVNLSDINQPNVTSNYRTRLIKALVRTLISCLTFDKNGITENFSDYLFLSKNIKQIKESINRNKNTLNTYRI